MRPEREEKKPEVRNQEKNNLYYTLLTLECEIISSVSTLRTQ
jgi:hypothetical protein